MHIEVAFRGLIAEGLFFEVHLGVFAEPCYFCSYDPEFLDELPEAKRHAKSWRQFRKYHDRASRGWKQAGLCWGQGREGGLSDGEIGLCLATSCCCFAQHPEKECAHELRYAPHLLPIRGKPFAKS